MGDEPYYHNVVLNRLDTYLQYGDNEVLFSRNSFADVDAWSNIPVIFAQVVDNSIAHPDFQNVDSGSLPAGYRNAGYISRAYIPDDGNPRLCADMVLTDLEVQAIAESGRLAISTGFSCMQEPDENGRLRMVGPITPNHVLVFVQGQTQDSYGRDNAAMFLNTVGETMTDETVKTELTGIRKMLSAIHDKFCNTAEVAAPVQAEPVVMPEVPEVAVESPVEVPAEEVAPVEEAAPVEEVVEEPVVDLQAENDALKAELEAMKAAEAQRVKDAAWDKIKVECPEGWLGEHETETRKLYEEAKDEFYSKLMNHKAQFKNTVAEGQKSASAPVDIHESMMNYINEVSAKTGYKFRI